MVGPFFIGIYYRLYDLFVYIYIYAQMSMQQDRGAGLSLARQGEAYGARLDLWQGIALNPYGVPIIRGCFPIMNEWTYLLMSSIPQNMLVWLEPHSFYFALDCDESLNLHLAILLLLQVWHSLNDFSGSCLILCSWSTWQPIWEKISISQEYWNSFLSCSGNFGKSFERR